MQTNRTEPHGRAHARTHARTVTHVHPYGTASAVPQPCMGVWLYKVLFVYPFEALTCLFLHLSEKNVSFIERYVGEHMQT